MKLNRKQVFEITFSLIVVVLFFVKCGMGDGGKKTEHTSDATEQTTVGRQAVGADDTLALAAARCDSVLHTLSPHVNELLAGGKPHRIYSVSDYGTAFPDINPVQIAAAMYHGVKPCETRADVKALDGKGLVCVSHSPYYVVAPLTSSQPYLVPRAQKLLNRIGRNFVDSLMVKHIPPSLMIVTSVTRSIEDIKKLKRSNVNAVESSCHSYGTTVDISYIKFEPYKDAGGNPLRQAREDSLKWVLSEVLNDLRKAGACYVKYERKQGCFHITVR